MGVRRRRFLSHVHTHNLRRRLRAALAPLNESNAHMAVSHGREGLQGRVGGEGWARWKAWRAWCSGRPGGLKGSVKWRAGGVCQGGVDGGVGRQWIFGVKNFYQGSKGLHNILEELHRIFRFT